MKKGFSLSGLIIYSSIFLWLYFIALIQLSNPTNPIIAAFSLVLHTIIYIGIHKKLVGSEIKKILSIGAFTITFAAFWVNIINIVFYYTELNPNENPILLGVIAVPYAVLFTLFHKTLDEKRIESVEDQESNAMQFILRLIFSITTVICASIATFFSYSSMQHAGPSTLLSILAITIVATVILTSLFENWLYGARKIAIKKALVAVTIAAAAITILLSWIRL